MNLGVAHTFVVGLAIIVAGTLAALHSLTSTDFQTITLAGIGSLTGHGVGYAHGMQSALKAAESLNPRVHAELHTEAQR